MHRDEIRIEVAFGFAGEVLLKGKRKTRPHIVSDKVVVSVPTVGSDEAPSVVEATGRWKEEGVRSSGGGFWRPICRYGAPLTVEEFAAFSSGESHRRSDDGDWYPFPTGSEGIPPLDYWRRGGDEDDRDIFDDKCFRIGTPAVRDFDRALRDDAAARCSRIASDGLLAIDGILHRSCAVPTLDVKLDYGFSSMRLVLDGAPAAGAVRVGLSDLDAVLAMPGVADAPDIVRFLSSHRIHPRPETSFDLRSGNAGNLARTMAEILSRRHSTNAKSNWGWHAREHSVLSAERIEERLAVLVVASEAVRCASGETSPDDLWRTAGEKASRHPEIGAALARFEEMFETLELEPNVDLLTNP